MDLPLQDGSFETRYLIGVTGGLFFSPQTETPGLVEAAGYGLSQTVYIVRASISGLYHMAVGAISSCNLRGPIGIFLPLVRQPGDETVQIHDAGGGNGARYRGGGVLHHRGGRYENVGQLEARDLRQFPHDCRDVRRLMQNFHYQQCLCHDSHS